MSNTNWVHYGRDAREIEQRILELNYLEVKKAELEKRISELREALTDDLVFCEGEKYTTVNATAILSRRIGVKATNGSSNSVYELLSDRGYDVSMYSYKKLASAVQEILEVEGELPEWLDGRIELYEQKYVTLRRRKE